MRMAFTLIGGKNWTGGSNYLLNLFKVLAQYQIGRLTPVLFVSDNNERMELAPFETIPGVDIVPTPHLSSRTRKIALGQALLWGRDGNLVQLFRNHRIDIVFESAQFFGWRLGLPAIAWIPDFQHRIMPRMFSLADWSKREIGFRAQVWGNRFIMVSSADARHDCEQNYPATRGRTRVVHFAVSTDPPVDPREARRIARSYDLPERFFYMPNQFWRHKNHAVVIEALAMLRRRGVPLVVAASGNPKDPRNPGHFTRLKALVAQYGIEDDFRFLGLIPFAHLTALMRTCTALLNPSLFEGWSTTVEEARSMGTPMLLSDIDVHREQMGARATYFNPHSSASLADALLCFPDLDEIRREQLFDEARLATHLRLKQFGEDFVSLAETVCRRSAMRRTGL